MFDIVSRRRFRRRGFDFCLLIRPVFPFVLSTVFWFVPCLACRFLPAGLPSAWKPFCTICPFLWSTEPDGIVCAIPIRRDVCDSTLARLGPSAHEHMASTAELRQEMILAALRNSGIDAHGFNDGLWAWRQLARQLTELIGEAGFYALYGRSVRLTAPEYPCLVMPSEPRVEGVLRSLLEILGGVDTSLASKANHALLHTCTRLLSTLIGEALTLQILKSAWDAGADTNHMENRR
jgi:hypothetical protein